MASVGLNAIAFVRATYTCPANEAIGRPAGFPQLLLRLGYAGDREPTPRREAVEVIISA